MLSICACVQKYVEGYPLPKTYNHFKSTALIIICKPLESFEIFVIVSKTKKKKRNKPGHSFFLVNRDALRDTTWVE